MNSVDTKKRGHASSAWTPPQTEDLELEFSYAHSVLEQFILKHSVDDVLRELVQNEYDASGNRMEVTFSEYGLHVRGNGRSIDNDGWRRLTVMLGTGEVASSKRVVKAKRNGIGSKNFGLRSLFLFGDRLFIRSGGKQTVLDVRQGAQQNPLPDAESRRGKGIRIFVPYRDTQHGKLERFSVERERRSLDRFSQDLADTLLKLAIPGGEHSLDTVVVSSERSGRRLTWKQSANSINRKAGLANLIQRTIRITDQLEGHPIRREQIDEQEFWCKVKVPEDLREQEIPQYFVLPGRCIRLAVSLRLTKGKIDLSHRGRYYYPLGAPDGYTGSAVSICAPFEMVDDRSKIVDPDQNRWNAWLIEQAVSFTLRLLPDDWFQMFGAQAYLALRPNQIDDTYSNLIEAQLRNGCYWPTRLRTKSRTSKPIFAVLSGIVVPQSIHFDGFLNDQRCYLDKILSDDPDVCKMALDLGAKAFGMNSLIRLRCGGKEAVLKTKLSKHEAAYYYGDFPERLKNQPLQIRFAQAIDAESAALELHHKEDLKNTQTTLTAADTLEACSSLQVIPSSLVKANPIPLSSRLHSALAEYKVLAELCQKFDILQWISSVADKIDQGTGRIDEHQALYRYLLSDRSKVNGKLKLRLQSIPVLLDHEGQWVAPKALIDRRAGWTKLLEPVLHFPHKDYATDKSLARFFEFRKQISASDIVAFARLVSTKPELAKDFEKMLNQIRQKLDKPTVEQLKSIRFLRSTKGTFLSPSEIYLRLDRLRICLGQGAPFTAGSFIDLYKVLECKSSPSSTDILLHIQELSSQSRKPENPSILYSELVHSLKSEKKQTNMYARQPVLWTGTRYAQPQECLIGRQFRETFIGGVPILESSASSLRDVYGELGAYFRPEQHHWAALLCWISSEYTKTHRLPPRASQSLRLAYLAVRQQPREIGDTQQWLLDAQEKLHTREDVRQHRFVIDDDPILVDELRRQNAPIAFAHIPVDDTELLSFFRDQMQVATISSIRRKIADHVILASEVRKRIDSAKLLARLHDADVASALFVIAQKETGTFTDTSLKRPDDLNQRLLKIGVIEFARKLQVEYEIAALKVQIPVPALLKEGGTRIIMGSIQSYNEAYDALAKLIADFFTRDLGAQRRIVDPFFRVLSSEPGRELGRYLHSRGIRLHPVSSNSALGSHDGVPVSSMDDTQDDETDEGNIGEEQHDISSVMGAIIAENLSQRISNTSRQADEETLTQIENPAPMPASTETTERLLPPLEDVQPRLLSPSDTWQPHQKGVSGGKGHNNGFRSYQPRNPQRDAEIGHRGEEIVFNEEVKRVVQLGFSAACVIWVSLTSPLANHDIKSVDDKGQDIWIEVKSTVGRDGRFEWSQAELALAIDKRKQYILYRVYETASDHPTLRAFCDPVDRIINGRMDIEASSIAAEVEPLSES